MAQQGRSVFARPLMSAAEPGVGPRAVKARIAISIALCTYNGASYLQEQLDSIAAQTRLPDEVVVCDDLSTDETAAMVASFAAAVRFPVRFIRNEERLGSTANFAKCIGLCTGDWIALSDQDDSWYPNRLQVTEDAFRNRPDAALVFCDADLADQRLNPLGIRLWASLRFTRRQQRLFRQGQAFRLLLRRNVVTGAASAFRSDLRPLILPIPGTSVHDEWIALVCSCVAECLPLPEPVIRYRQHPTQQIGAGREPLIEKYRKARRLGLSQYTKDLDRFGALYARLSEAAGQRPDRLKMRRLARKLKFCRRRLALMTGSRWRVIVIVLAFLSGKYHRYASGWRAAARDMSLVLTPNPPAEGHRNRELC